LERHFLGIPNLWIVALNRRIHPREVYSAVYEHITHPVLVVENKVLYTRTLNSSPIPGFLIEASDERFPTLRVSPRDGLSPEVTVVCYGGVLDEVEQAVELAFDEDEIVCEILCPTLVHPVNIAPIVDSLRKSGRLLVVEEGGTVAAWGSEIAARVLESRVRPLAVRRMGCDGVIPSCLEAEMSLLPNVTGILGAIRELRHGS
jgi:2-oxoisovalerate dehydrogenase E1 component